MARPEKGGRAPLEPGCPSLEEWGRYEAGLYPEGIAAQMFEHASECSPCGELLTDMHSGTESGRETIVALRSNTTEWKKEMLARIAFESAGMKKRSVVHVMAGGYRWAAVAAAPMIVVGGGVQWMSVANSPAAAVELMANAYSEQRPF